MKLAKQQIDVGVMTERLEEMLTFWQGPAGLPFEGVLPTGGGNHQHRHGANGSVFKLNHPRKGLPDTKLAGYRGLTLAREGLDKPEALEDPDGNRLLLVPPGHDGITGLALTVGVRDVQEHARYYRNALGLEEVAEGRYRSGDSLVVVERDPNAPADADFYGLGFRYFTIQVFDCRREHARVLEAGGTEACAAAAWRRGRDFHGA